MASVANQIIIVLIALSFVFGQTIRPTFFDLSVPLIDLLLPFLATTNVIIHISKKEFKIHNQPFLYFLGIVWLTLILNLTIHHFSPIRPLFYLIRLTSLISFFILPIQIKPKIGRFFNLCIIANITFGLIQYFIWPDFTYFNALQWDPHLYRLVSTFFDPTFTALIYLIFLISIFTSDIDRRFKLPLLAFTYFALALTYSRSTFLALVLVSFVYAFIQKNFKIFIVTILLVATTIIVLPRHAGEGSKLERTSSLFAKVENYRQAIGVIATSPIIGYGYNTLSQLPGATATSHASNGFDNSLLTIWSATGIFGLIVFVAGLYTLFRPATVTLKLTLVAVLIHSLFANSLLYPWILFYLAFLSAPSTYRK